MSRAVIEQTRLLVTSGYSPADRAEGGHADPVSTRILRATPSPSGRTASSCDPTTRKFTNGDLTALLSENPEQFTPNAVLRPLYQDSLFPTLAVVLGPSEIAYFSQLPLAYKGMNIPMPVVFPRASLTLVEPRMERLLSKFDLTLREPSFPAGSG